MEGRPTGERALRSWHAMTLIALAVLLAYANSLAVPFLFDDVPTIVDNPALRSWRAALGAGPAEAGGLTLSGRPIVALSLFLNHALSGDAVWSYHATNLLIHLLAAWTLFGLTRITLSRPVLRPLVGGAAVPLGGAIALLWAVHPLQTESVTYVVQRAESLMGLFYLLTLYASARSALARADGTPAARRWQWLAVASCAAGMACKEVMVTAPVMVWLYDRTFFAGGFRTAWRERRWLYVGLAATWLLLAWFVFSTGGNRGGTVGFGVGVTPWAYAATQFEAVARYLQLGLWPAPLVFEYGTFWVQRATDVLPFALLVLPLLAATMVALWRWPVAGFAGAFYFGVLAPTSLTPGTIQMIVEHRGYLSLAALISLVVVAAHRCLGRLVRWLIPVLAVLMIGLTLARNRDYTSELRLWTVTVLHRPQNATALTNLGMAQFRAGNIAGARSLYERALQANPKNVEAHYNLGILHVREGRLQEALAEYQMALRLRPKLARAHNNLGNVLMALGREGEAVERYTEAARLDPVFAEPHNNLGNIRLHAGHPAEAITHFETALRLKPDYAEARYNLGNALAQTGRMPEAIAQYERALVLQPNSPDTLVNLGNALLELERVDEAVRSYEAALRLRPALAEAHNNLGMVLLHTGRVEQSIAHFEQALAARPDFAAARENLGEARRRSGR